MDKAVFVDIDTQVDFMDPRGKLYVPDARLIVPVLKKLTSWADKNSIPVISSMDSHTKNDPEFKMFPAHCLKDSAGFAKIKATLAEDTRQIFLIKHTFDIFSNRKSKKLFREFDTAYVYGVALDFCVKAACLGLVSLGKKTYLVEDATCPVSAGEGRRALKLLKKKGVKFIHSSELMKK